jgi:hypothetical protein
MSEGPFTPEDFKDMDFNYSPCISESASVYANSHPFVKETWDVVKYYSVLDNEFGEVAEMFLTKYFPEKKEKK